MHHCKYKHTCFLIEKVENAFLPIIFCRYQFPNYEKKMDSTGKTNYLLFIIWPAKNFAHS